MWTWDGHTLPESRCLTKLGTGSGSHGKCFSRTPCWPLEGTELVNNMIQTWGFKQERLRVNEPSNCLCLPHSSYMGRELHGIPPALLCVRTRWTFWGPDLSCSTWRMGIRHLGCSMSTIQMSTAFLPPSVPAHHPQKSEISETFSRMHANVHRNSNW